MSQAPPPARLLLSPSLHDHLTRSSLIAPPRRRGGGFFRTFLLYVGVCWGVVGVLVAPLIPGGWFTVVALALLSYLPLVVFLRGRAAGRYAGAPERLLVFRPFIYTQLLLPAAATGGLLGAFVGALSGGALHGGRVGLLAAATAGTGGLVLGWAGSRSLRVRHLRATWPDLPPGLDGLRIVQLSDLHVGPHTSRRFLARVRQAVADARPDLIALTGDLVDDHAPDVAPFGAAFGTLAAPLGVYAIPGNHDVYAGWADVAWRLRELPLTVLENQAVTLTRGESRLVLAGIGDPAGRGTTAGPDPDRALAGVPPGAFTIVLAHNPALWPPLAERGVQLTLSGHTHWGQLALPRRNWSLATPFLGDLVMGAYRRGRSLLYITPGTGFWGVPFRLGAWPEVAVITLARGPEPAIEVERA